MSRKAFNQKAFSLIEILLVIVIMGFIFAFSSQFFTKKSAKVKTVFERFSRLNKRLVNLSQLHNKSYRLVFNLSSQKKDEYWVEKLQNLEANNSEIEELEQTTQEEQQKPIKTPEYQTDKAFYPKPQLIPSLLDIIKIETQNSVKTEDLVYIYYRPSALAQKTKIHFLRPDNHKNWTLYIDPISKQLEILKGEK